MNYINLSGHEEYFKINFYIAELHGTFHQMGRQYGLLFNPQLAQFYQEVIVDYLMKEKEAPCEELVMAGQANYDAYPAIFREYYDGMAEFFTRQPSMTRGYFLNYKTGRIATHQTRSGRDRPEELFFPGNLRCVFGPVNILATSIISPVLP